MAIYKKKITVNDGAITSGVHLTLRQSLLPNALGMFVSIVTVKSTR
jgi:FHS family L-fucose permease-like MFS transporter